MALRWDKDYEPSFVCKITDKGLLYYGGIVVVGKDEKYLIWPMCQIPNIENWLKMC